MSFMYVVQYMYFLFHISISMYICIYIYRKRERNIVVQIQATFPKRVQQQQVSTRDAPKYTECCVFLVHSESKPGPLGHEMQLSS